MGTQGVFGYIIGKKKRFMHVQYDANLLWQICVREIYILIKHYCSIENLQTEFEKIKTVNYYTKPKEIDIEKCKIFTDVEFSLKNVKDWYCLLKYCQSSYINMLESGFILNTKYHSGHIFVLDFNKKDVSFYTINNNNSKSNINYSTIKELMEFENMPICNLIEVLDDIKSRYKIWINEMDILNITLEKLNTLKIDSKKQGDLNMEDKINKLVDNNENKKRELIFNRREFYNRLKILDLIEE